MRPVAFIASALTALALTIAPTPVGPRPEPARAQAAGARFTIAPGSSEARFRAREVLLGKIITSEAVGRTKDVSGAIVFSPDGAVASDQSAITVELRNLTSDEFVRDTYIKSNTLKVGTYPTVKFVPTAVDGLAWPLPASGPVSFQMTGNLTVRDQTRPVTWALTADLTDGQATGNATTTITFTDFNLSRPEVDEVASVEDAFKLELDFLATREAQ